MLLLGMLVSLTAPAWGAAEESPLGPTIASGAGGAERLPEAVETVTVLGREDIDTSGALALDGLLREVPSFSLSGRAPGLVADPLSQAVSLRGAGPGEASRAVILVDGIPVNDPFGGWMSWARIPASRIERIEVVRGPSPTIWGTGTTGGLIHVTTPPVAPSAAGTELSYGDRGTTALSLFGTAARSLWSGRLDADLGETDGHTIVRRAQRGAIDVDADARYRLVTQTLQYRPLQDTTLSVTGSYFAEERGGGTPRQASATEAGGVTLGVRQGTVPSGQWDYTAFVSRQSFDTRVSSATADRSSETVALTQSIPTDSAGAAVQWTRRFLRQTGVPGPHFFTAGADARWIEGESREEEPGPTGVSRRRRAGGRQLQAGLFAQDIDAIFPWLEVMMGIRLDYWRSLSGAVETEDGGGFSRKAIEDRQAASLGSRTAVRYRPTDALTLRASVAEGFRPPTLYEQYGTARVRDDVTVARSSLDAERMARGELGVEYRLPAALTVRGAGFWNELFDSIGHVTLPADEGREVCGAVATCRQRRNLDHARVIGTELEVEYRQAPGWYIHAGYLYQESWVLRAAGRPAIEGNRLAQVPRHQLTAGARVRRPPWPALSVQLRYLGPRFEDDRNTLRLAGAVVVDVTATAAVGHRGELFVSVENVFDAEVEAGKTSDGIVTTGAPRLIRAGLRLRF